MACELYPVLTRQHHVDQDQIRRISGIDCTGCIGVKSGRDSESLRLQQVAHQLRYSLLVFDHENMRLLDIRHSPTPVSSLLGKPCMRCATLAMVALLTVAAVPSAWKQ